MFCGGFPNVNMTLGNGWSVAISLIGVETSRVAAVFMAVSWAFVEVRTMAGVCGGDRAFFTSSSL